jgi:hypothetical protein
MYVFEFRQAQVAGIRKAGGEPASAQDVRAALARI